MQLARYFSIILIIAISIACGSDVQNNETTLERPASDSTTATVDAFSEDAAAITSSKKKELLASIIGEYSLESISGFTGANTMMDYNIVDGSWSASGSSNVGGMREGFDIDLSAEELHKLQSAKIVVGEDLSVSYLCDGKTYFTVPFSEAGMDFQLKKPASEYISAMPETMEASSTFIEGVLYLYARDEVPSEEIEPIDIAQVSADAILLRYSESGRDFDLHLFYGDCCDNSIYIFK